MTTTKEQIKFLDDLISWFGQPPFRWKDKAKVMLAEIKEKLEKEYIHEQNIINYGTGEPQPDNEELVEKLLKAGIDCVIDVGHGFDEPQFDKESGKAEIRTLLQSRQPEKPRITRGEIEVQVCPIADNICISNILNIFKE